ncbi:hypothetical protein ACFPYI_03350 [Halomarina salina]|uniref:TraB family protein n=1 Tax=Halomarina salina TaxID=1872699 RepID=A0ABD5RIQ9_9EURY|nr:hypothetical protein [Halomarina salina]
MSQRRDPTDRTSPLAPSPAPSTEIAPPVPTGDAEQRASPADGADQRDADSRLDEPFCRRIDREGGTTLHLVGVVHDHPASVARVRRVVAATTPDALALELPDGSLPLYRQFAERDGDSRRGGEMSAAVDAAPDARVVGIDPLDARFVRSMAATVVRERHDRRTAWSLAKRTVGIARRIAHHRLAAAGLRDRSTVDDPTTYGCEDASPDEQADHESEHVSRCCLFRGVTERPPAVEITTDARERRMAERLDALDAETVVAVVGWGHLDALVRRLGSAR